MNNPVRETLIEGGEIILIQETQINNLLSIINKRHFPIYTADLIFTKISEELNKIRLNVIKNN